MKNEKILLAIVAILVLVVGFQGYSLYNINKNLTDQKTVKQIAHTNTQIKPFAGANPFEEMQKMQKEMDRIFNNMNSNFAMMPEFENFFKDMSISPSVNLQEFKDRYEISINLPGSSEQNIKIKVDNGVLSVEAKTQKQTDKSKSNFIQKEIYEGSFSRSITLPQDAKGDDFKSKFENGVLKITIPKKS